MKWIRLEDELPQHLQKVLVTGDYWPTAEVAFYDDKQLQFIPSTSNVFGGDWEVEPYKVGHGVNPVTFWMPLPVLPDKLKE